MENIECDKLLLKEPTNQESRRKHPPKLRKGKCLDNINKNNFPQRHISVWNGLKVLVLDRSAQTEGKLYIEIWRQINECGVA